jgi:hypothetical protein
MSLTLIQQQVLASLVAETGHDSRRRGRGVHPSDVRERLRTMRPRPVSEQYVRGVLRDLTNQRADGLPLVRERVGARGRRYYLPLNAAYDYVDRRGLS